MFSFLYHCQYFLPDSDDCIYEQRGERIIGTETSKPSRGPELTSTPTWWGSVLLIILVFCAVLLCVCTSWISCCDVRYDFRMKTTFGSSLPPVVCMRDHVLFTLFVFVCVSWFPAHIVLCFCFVFLSLVQSMLPFPLDCPFLIAHSLFSNVY